VVAASVTHEARHRIDDRLGNRGAPRPINVCGRVIVDYPAESREAVSNGRDIDTHAFLVVDARG
jgi:hypothetical protein